MPGSEAQCFGLRCNLRPSIKAAKQSSGRRCRTLWAGVCAGIRQRWFLPGLGKKLSVFGVVVCVDARDKGDWKVGVVLQQDAPVPAPALAWEMVVVGCPVFGFCEMNHRAVGYTDYTRVVTCLIEIGLN